MLLYLLQSFKIAIVEHVHGINVEISTDTWACNAEPVYTA